MQAIAISPKVFEENFCNYYENLSLSVQTIERIKKFHIVYTDKNGKWFEELSRIKGQLSHNEKDVFDNIIIKQLSKTFEHIEIAEKDSDLNIELARKTIDSLLLGTTKEKVEAKNELKNNSVKWIKQSEFISDEYKPNNILFRIPKIVKVAPEYNFRNFDFLAPYIRGAKKIEIMDKQLFKDSRNDSEVQLFVNILKYTNELKEVQLYWEPNEHNLRYIKFKKEIGDLIGNVTFLENCSYLGRSKNHDRFIIVDHDEYSIRFSTSFNNFYKNSDGNFGVKAGFSISYENGRSFYQE